MSSCFLADASESSRDQISNVVPQVQAGTIRLYAIADRERNPALPDVPTARDERAIRLVDRHRISIVDRDLLEVGIGWHGEQRFERPRLARD